VVRKPAGDASVELDESDPRAQAPQRAGTSPAGGEGLGRNNGSGTEWVAVVHSDQATFPGHGHGAQVAANRVDDPGQAHVHSSAAQRAKVVAVGSGPAADIQLQQLLMHSRQQRRHRLLGLQPVSHGGPAASQGGGMLRSSYASSAASAMLYSSLMPPRRQWPVTRTRRVRGVLRLTPGDFAGGQLRLWGWGESTCAAVSVLPAFGDVLVIEPNARSFHEVEAVRDDRPRLTAVGSYTDDWRAQ